MIVDTKEALLVFEIHAAVEVWELLVLIACPPPYRRPLDPFLSSTVVRASDVPSHLHYIMLELIKNSMRATVDFHGLDEMDNNPIRVVIADGEENEV